MEDKEFYTLNELKDEFIGQKGTPQRDEYEEEINKLIKNEEPVSLYKFDYNEYYFTLYGLFLATDSEITELLTQDRNFGEVGGKHSEVIIYHDEWNDCITKITDDQEFIELMKVHGIAFMGYNPFDDSEIINVEEDEEGDEDE